MRRYAVGLDMGTSSIGWAVVLLNEKNEPRGLDDWGVRIFPSGRDEKTNDPLAAARREARGIRRRGDRLKMRRRILLNKLVKHGLMPAAPEEQKKLGLLDPIALRAKGVTEKLSLHEVGRALFHLQQRRGFKSNRKEQDDNEAGAISKGGNELSGALKAQGLTLGQFLHLRQREGHGTRFTKRMAGNKVEYDLYPLRSMVEDEFNTLWDAQKQFYGVELSEAAHKEIHRAIFHQRPLKPQPRGRCLFNSDEERMPAAMPSAQHFRILKEIHNIRIKGVAHPAIGTPISAEQKDKLYKKLLTQGSMTEKSVKTLLNLNSEESINLFVKGVREKLLGDETAAEMRKDDRYGKEWDALPLEKQDAIVLLLTDTIKVKRAGDKNERLLHDEEIVQRLIEEQGCSQEQAERVLKARIPTKLLKFGAGIITQLLPLMQQGMSEYDALVALGKNHSRQYTGEVMDALPYYGAVDSLQPHVVPMKSTDPMVNKYGRVSNPTVHVALNQLRKLMNQLVERYGCHPQRITLEMVRELKKGRKEVAEIIKNIKTNEKERDKFKEIIASHGLTATDHYIAKLKLWSELAETGQPQHRTCVYTGEAISISQVLSEQTEIEHILPQSRTLDDTAANKTLTFTEVNRAKGEMTPAEFFANPQKLRGKTIDYAEVLERANSLKGSKKWRFAKEAMEVFESKMQKITLSASLGGDVDTEIEAFAARHLVDTSYIAKFAKKYLAYICHNGEREVMATPGTLTGLLRKSWGLNQLIAEVNEKDRSDHRHHAVDALVIAMTTRSMIKRVADASKRSEVKGIKLVKEIPAPWDGFTFAALKEKCDGIIISHKPDHGSPAMGHGTTGQLHKDTAYGLTNIPATKKGCGVFVTRWTAESFKKVEHLDDIRDARLRDTLKQYICKALGECSMDAVADKEVSPLVAKFMQERGIKGIRCLEERPLDVMVPIGDKQTKQPYKYFVGGSNHCAEIYVGSTGKTAGKWQVEIISTFDANQKGFVPKWRGEHPDAKLVMRLHIDDMVAYEDEGKRVICRVKKMTGDMIYLRPHHIAVEQADKLSWAASAKQLQLANARKVSVRIDGTLYDPKEAKTEAA